MSEQKNRLDLIDLNDYPVSWWLKLLDLGHKIVQDPAAYSEACKGKIMGTLFYEPSTRTQMSFQPAMLRLGGTIIGFDNPATSSVAKGENIKDTTKIVSGYADIMVMRHPTAGSVKAAALTADCPVINAGDGGHLHPTQTLTDLLTLREEKGRLDLPGRPLLYGTTPEFLKCFCIESLSELPELPEREEKEQETEKEEAKTFEVPAEEPAQPAQAEPEDGEDFDFDEFDVDADELENMYE